MITFTWLFRSLTKLVYRRAQAVELFIPQSIAEAKCGLRMCRLMVAVFSFIWRSANAAVLMEASMLSIYLGCMAVLPDDTLNRFTG